VSCIRVLYAPWDLKINVAMLAVKLSGIKISSTPNHEAPALLCGFSASIRAGK